MTCVLSAFTVLREDGSASTSTGTSGDFSECTSDQRLTIRASWVDDRGDRHHHFVTTARFALNTRFEGVASDFVVTSEVTYRLCEPQTGCRYQVTTAPK